MLIKSCHLDILKSDLGNACPNTKLFAIRFSNTFGLNKSVEIDQRGLAKTLGLSVHIVRTATQHLKRHKHLSLDTCPQLRGRAIYRYRLHPIYRPVKDGLPETTEHHLPLIELLLRPEHHPWLKAPEKILLATLLLYADIAGVVDNLGFPMLSAAIGCSEDRLRHHLRQLTRKAYLYPPIPGMTCRYLLGQCHSLYAIRLQNIYRGSADSRRTVLVLEKDLFVLFSIQY